MSARRHASPEKSAASAIAIVAVGFVAVILVLVLLEALDFSGHLAGISFGVAVVLVGVVGLVRSAWSGGDLASAALHVAVVLAGAVLIGGNWGAALGLGLLASTAMYLASRRPPDESDS